MTFQDYALVKQYMDEMNNIFDAYIKIIDAINMDIEDGINNGVESALDSAIVGKPFKDQWEALYDEFEALKDYFDETYSKVAVTTQNNAQLEDTAAGNIGGVSSAQTTSKPILRKPGNNGSGPVALVK